MSRVKKNLYNILKGSFLTDEGALRNWRIILFVVVLLLIVISSAHSADEKVIQIAALNKKKRELRAAYVDVNTILTRLKLESTIRKQVKPLGLAPADTPPQKIKVTIDSKK